MTTPTWNEFQQSSPALCEAVVGWLELWEERPAAVIAALRGEPDPPQRPGQGGRDAPNRDPRIRWGIRQLRRRAAEHRFEASAARQVAATLLAAGREDSWASQLGRAQEGDLLVAVFEAAAAHAEERLL